MQGNFFGHNNVAIIYLIFFILYIYQKIFSDQISLDRYIKDQRSSECRKLIYNELPKASVIIIFTDEAWSPLLRTVHSVVNRTPKNLLKEIVLVDDFSQRGKSFKNSFLFFLKQTNLLYVIYGIIYVFSNLF